MMGFFQALERFQQKAKEDAIRRAYRKAHGVDPPKRTESWEMVRTPSGSVGQGARAPPFPDAPRGTRLGIRPSTTIMASRAHTGEANRSNTNTANARGTIPTESDNAPPPPYNEDDERRRVQFLRPSNSRTPSERPGIPDRISSREPNSTAAANPAERLPFYITTTPPTTPSTAPMPNTAAGRLPDCAHFGCGRASHAPNSQTHTAEPGRSDTQFQLPEPTFTILPCFSTAEAVVRRDWRRSHGAERERRDFVHRREGEGTDSEVIDGILGSGSKRECC